MEQVAFPFLIQKERSHDWGHQSMAPIVAFEKTTEIIGELTLPEKT